MLRIHLSNICILYVLLVSGECILSSIDVAYKKGVSAYNGERWSECITHFEEALHLYKIYKSLIVNCRLKCKFQQYDTIIKDDMEDLKIYERFLLARNCVNNCQEKGFGDASLNRELDGKMLFNFHARKPYEYLHMCYFQMYSLPKAASAAYTYLVTNLEDDKMKHNIEYYIEQPEVDVNEVIDLESEDFKVHFQFGAKSYNLKNWAETVANMEKVLTDYFSSENICRAECETLPDQETSPEFVITVSNNIVSLLHCQQNCQDRLIKPDYKSGIDFIADVLNYLQFSYYQLDRFDDAAKSVASYLALIPNNEEMLSNKKIYTSLTNEKSFYERSDVVYYKRRDSYEKNLLNLFHKGDNY